jgi:WD40 repeat protein
MALSRSETTIATGHKDGSIKLWDSKSKDQAGKFDEAHADPVSCIRYTPNELYLVSTSKDDSLKVWDLRKNQLLNSFEHDLFKVGSHKNKFCVSPNSKIAVCGTKEGSMVYYDIVAGECVDIVPDKHKSQIVAVEWHPRPDNPI